MMWQMPTSRYMYRIVHGKVKVGTKFKVRDSAIYLYLEFEISGHILYAYIKKGGRDIGTFEVSEFEITEFDCG